MAAGTANKILVGTAGALVAVGATNGIAYGYGKDLSQPQTKPEGMNHTVGFMGGALVGGAGFAAMVLGDFSPGISKTMIFGSGAAVGAYALAPIFRRAMAD